MWIAAGTKKSNPFSTRYITTCAGWEPQPVYIMSVLDGIHLCLSLLLIHREKKALNRSVSLSLCWLLSPAGKGVWRDSL